MDEVAVPEEECAVPKADSLFFLAQTLEFQWAMKGKAVGVVVNENPDGDVVGLRSRRCRAATPSSHRPVDSIV